MSLRPYMLPLVILFLALAPAHAVAAAKVDGAVLYGAGQYRAEVAGKEAQKITSQYGQVSLAYRTQDGIARLGKYTLMLGYEFNILDPTLTDNGIKDPAVERIETGKVLYQGDILLAPGGLPFRFNAYARDINRSSFTSVVGGRLPDLPLGVQGGKKHQAQTTLLSPGIVTDIEDGTHHEMGATLVIGIRNGSYLGDYRNVLSQLPRLMIDYKQIEVTDLARDSNQQHYRERDLAFISLNKKDNWTHFRTHDYKDYLDASQDSETTQVMIGTVDQLLSRQWINLTNWIKISGDISYTTKRVKYDEFAENSYNVNLFTSFQRNTFNSTVLSSFERITQGTQLEQEFDLPAYFNYAPNRDSFYRGSLRSNFYRQSALVGLPLAGNQVQDNRSDISFDLGSEFFRTRAIVFKPRIMLGIRNDDNAQSVNEKLTLEWTNPRSNFLSWTVGGSLASTQATTDTNSSLYREQSLYGNVDKSLNRTTHVGLRATVRRGSGQRDDYVVDRVEIGTAKTNLDSTSNRFLLYNGQVYGEHVGTLFSNRLEVVVAAIKADVEDLTSTQVQHMLKMAGQTSKFSLSSALSRGTEATVETVNTEYLSDENSSDESAGFGWSSKAEYSYTPDRRLNLTLRGSIKGISGDAESYTTWLGSETLGYSFYKSNGIVRKLAEITEEFGVEGTSNRFSERNKTFFLRTMAAVYPRNYYAKVVSELLVYDPSGSRQIELNAETGAIFQKMQVALSYGRGYKEAEGLLAEVKEERWEVKVRKTF